MCPGKVADRHGEAVDQVDPRFAGRWGKARDFVMSGVMRCVAEDKICGAVDLGVGSVMSE